MNPMQSCSSTLSCGHLTQGEYPRQFHQLLGPYEQELHDHRLRVEAGQKKEQTELDERIKEQSSQMYQRDQAFQGQLAQEHQRMSDRQILFDQEIDSRARIHREKMERLKQEFFQSKLSPELSTKERQYLKISEPMDPITDSFGVLATQKHMAPVSFQETSLENFLWMRPLNEDEKTSSSKGAPLPRYKPWGPATEGASRATQGASQRSYWGFH